MTASEIKMQVIKKIQSLDDEKVLDEIYHLLLLDATEPGVYQLDNKQKHMLNEAMEDVKHNRLSDHDQAKKEIEEWLSK
jgi:hypothetical protein